MHEALDKKAEKLEISSPLKQEGIEQVIFFIAASQLFSDFSRARDFARISSRF
jgi:hypothetical protein